MKVVIKSVAEGDLEKNDYLDEIQIEIDGERVFQVSDGEPEDNNLCRNFNACYGIGDLMKRAYEAGANGELLDLDYEDLEIM